MTLVTDRHDFHYETANVCRLFVPHEKIVTVKTRPQDAAGLLAYTRLTETADGAAAFCELSLDEYRQSREAIVPRENAGGLIFRPFRDRCELTLATLLYDLLCDLFGQTQSWGVLTGVRPIKVLRQTAARVGEETAMRVLAEDFLVSDEKCRLARRVLHAENECLALSRPESCSLYISIPFCPTRCDYCSFVSHTTERSATLIPAYVDLLQQELRATAQVIDALGLKLETVYMGGGTPTSLSAEDLSAIFATVEAAFDLSALREYTVEAGRPDTVTAAKLHAIRDAGIRRISINPQTLHDPVLAAIGRKHTAAQFYEAFDLARQVGFDVINTDLIAGLPTDTADGFAETVDGIRALSPENVTVHTLSMKRASNLVVQHRTDIGAPEETPRMVALADTRLTAAGYHPYYLYRQGRMVGNQENVGWAKDDCDGLYNVYIMDETHTIFGCGAGAVTKLKEPRGSHIERIFNYKFPYEYNAGFPEMLARKAGITDFYTRYPVS